MDIWLLVMEIGALLGAAFLFGIIAQRLNQSAIVGYLLAGAITGPLLFNKTAVQNVAELGVALLLFSIGLEFSFSRLKQVDVRSFLVGILQILATMGVFVMIFAFRGPIRQALVMGAVIALSSTAIVLRVLVDRTEIDSIHGRNALAVLLTQDAAVVPLVLLVTVMGHGGDMTGVAFQILKTFAAAGGLAVVFFVLFFIVIPKVLMTSGLFANRELVVLLTIAIAFGSAWTAHAIGLSPALGAFIAGMLLAESPFATQIRSDIGSLRTLFVTLFFTSIGMLADPAWFLSNSIKALFWLAVVFALKVLVVFVICLLFRFNRLPALATGITLGQIGEFSFVLATEAYRKGIVADGMFDLIVTVTILSMFLSPYMATYAVPLSKRFFSIFNRQKRPYELEPAAARPGHSARTFIVGFGPAGQRVADVLLENCISPVVIELNPRTAAIARQKGLAVRMADTTNSETVAHLEIKGACLVIITVPDPRSVREIIGNIRVFSPESMIIARSRYHIASAGLSKAGANVVVDEENTIGDMLAKEIIESLRQMNLDALGCALAGEKP